LLDEELADEVGWTLFARCQSILDAGLQHEGRVRCVECRETVELTWEDAMIVCTFCDWECSSVAYRRTIKYKKLNAGGMRPFIEDYVGRYPAAKTSAEKLILIDTLIHRYHWETNTGAGRPGSVGLIEGKMKDIMPFLDKLSYGTHVPAGVEQTRAEWRKKWDRHPSKDRIFRRQAEERAKRKTASRSKRNPNGLIP
jgi:hypothetical protein